MPRAREFTTTEAAYLASACLASEVQPPAAASPRQVLLRSALAWSGASAPVTERAVNKAIEEEVLSPARAARVTVDEGAILYLVSTRTLEGVMLSRDAKARLYGALKRARRARRDRRWEIAPSLYFAPGRSLGRWQALLRTYADDRDRYVVADPAIMGGAPVIRGTRIPVYSILARLEGGDTVDDLVADDPAIPRAAFETAAVYARTHPRRGRPMRRFR